MIQISNNKFTKKNLVKGANAWNGTNLSDAGLGDDINNPTVFGVNEPGGFNHFQNVQQPEISHD